MRKARRVGLLVQVGHQHRALHRRQLLEHALDALDRVDALAGVVVAVAGEQHLRRDLTEAVEHAADAEVGRARRPDRAEAGGCQHRDHRLGPVRQKTDDTIALDHASGSETGGTARHAVVQLGVAQRLAVAAFVAEHQRSLVVAMPQQVLREVEPGAVEPPGARHARRVGHHPVPAARVLHAAERPDRRPEAFRVLDAPLVERGVGVERGLVVAPHQLQELEHAARRLALRARRPQAFADRAVAHRGVLPLTSTRAPVRARAAARTGRPPGPSRRPRRSAPPGPD